MKEIALVLSLSDRVAEKDIKTALPFEHHVYTLSIDHPNVHFLQAKLHLDDFRVAFSQVLTEIKDTHGLDCNIHLITAVPLDVAVEIGRQYRTQHPRMLVYELDNETKTIAHVLTLPT
jgi:SMODS-associated and fused to various effectors sensor domain